MIWVPLAIIAVSKLVGIAADVVRSVSDSAIERQRNRQTVLLWRRECLRRETEYKARGKLLDYLSALAAQIKVERDRTNEVIATLKNSKLQMKDFLIGRSKNLPAADKRRIREALSDVEDSINVYYAEKYRFSLFLDEVYVWKTKLTSKSVYFKLSRSMPQRSLDNFFVAEDFPIAKRLVHVVVRKPKTGPEFLLDGDILGVLPSWEDKPRKALRQNERLLGFVESINYKDRRAHLSLKKAELISSVGKGKAFVALVESVNPSGSMVTLNRVRCFLPRSKEISHPRPKVGDKIRVKPIQMDGKFNKFIVAEVGQLRLTTKSTTLPHP